MTSFQTTINAIAIHRAGDSPIFGDSATIVRLDDEGGGPFIVIEQVTATQPSVVKLDPDEITIVMRTASRLLRQESIERGGQDMRDTFVCDLCHAQCPRGAGAGPI